MLMRHAENELTCEKRHEGTAVSGGNQEDTLLQTRDDNRVNRQEKEDPGISHSARVDTLTGIV